MALKISLGEFKLFALVFSAKILPRHGVKAWHAKIANKMST